jgi:hypothetical protein
MAEGVASEPFLPLGDQGHKVGFAADYPQTHTSLPPEPFRLLSMDVNSREKRWLAANPVPFHLMLKWRSRLIGLPA